MALRSKANPDYRRGSGKDDEGCIDKNAVELTQHRVCRCLARSAVGAMGIFAMTVAAISTSMLTPACAGEAETVTAPTTAATSVSAEKGGESYPPLKNPFTKPPMPRSMYDSPYSNRKVDEAFVPDEKGEPVSDRESDAVEYIKEERKALGVKGRLYDNPDNFFFDDTPPGAFTLLDYARNVTKEVGDPADFPSSSFSGAVVSPPTSSAGDGRTEENGEKSQPTASAVGEKEVPQESQKWIRIAGGGFMLNEKTVQRHFCPQARRVAWARHSGSSRVFGKYSIFARDHKLMSLDKQDFGEFTYVKEHDGGKGKAPIVAVLEVPVSCFLSFMWRKRFDVLKARALDVVAKDESAQSFVETGEKLTAVVPVGTATGLVQRMTGFYRFYKIVEELGLNPNTQLRDLLEPYAIKCIKYITERHSDLSTLARKQGRPVTLRFAFFNLSRFGVVNVLGNSIYKSEMADGWGINDEPVWLDGVMKPNPVYFKAVLCGAKEESWLLVKDLVERSFNYKSTGYPALEWLLNGELSLDVPSDVSELPGPYSQAGECTTESLMQYIRTLPQPSGEEREVPDGASETRSEGKFVDFFKKKVPKFFKEKVPNAYKDYKRRVSGFFNCAVYGDC